ncbi:unnamed protein product [Prorocentrum cordatum]|uniref:Uncharacterized protein n=1 Tax=Prorocentrum cordatum TaxID=2364126 RepID=A0ABN9SZF5_9DINO|nr:unnamed protein product [Polarella glacialis]
MVVAALGAALAEAGPGVLCELARGAEVEAARGALGPGARVAPRLPLSDRSSLPGLTAAVALPRPGRLGGGVAGLGRWTHERLLLWPVHRDRRHECWVAETPDGDRYVERKAHGRWHASLLHGWPKGFRGDVVMVPKGRFRARCSARWCWRAVGLHARGAVGAAYPRGWVPTLGRSRARWWIGTGTSAAWTLGCSRARGGGSEANEEATRLALGPPPLEDAETMLLVAGLHAGGGLQLGDEVAPTSGDVAAGSKVIGSRLDGRPVLCERVSFGDVSAWRAEALANAGRATAIGGADTPRQGGEAAGREDARTLSAEWNMQGARFKVWRRAVGESCEGALGGCELRWAGTALHLCQRLTQHGGDPETWMSNFCQEYGISQRDRTWHELNRLISIFWLAGTFDAVKLGGPACLEVAARRAAQITEADRLAALGRGRALAAGGRVAGGSDDVAGALEAGGPPRGRAGRRRQRQRRRSWAWARQGEAQRRSRCRRAQIMDTGLGARPPPGLGAEAMRGGQVHPLPGLRELDADLAAPLGRRDRARVRQLANEGLASLNWSHGGVFFVKKKGDRQRPIPDCRPANRTFRSPPGVGLVSGDRLGRVERLTAGGADLGEELDDALGELGTWLGASDVKDCFHWLLLDDRPGLQEFFGRPPPRACELGPPQLGGAALGKDTLIYPLAESQVRAALTAATESFGSVGLEVHETSSSSAGGEALGVQLGGRTGCTRPTPARFWRVRGAVQALLRRRRVSGLELEIVVGHRAFLGLVRRESLSCFHCIYRSIQRHCFERVALWDSVVQELRAFSALMIYLRADWGAGWLPGVYLSDATLDGFGPAYSLRGPGSVGRAVEAAGLELLADGGVGAREATPAIPDAGVARWSQDPDFEEVPAELLHAGRWRTVLAVRWAIEEGAPRLEGRAVLKAAGRVASSGAGHDGRALLLGDNTSVIFAFSRSRARDFKLLAMILHAAACSFWRGLRFSYRWIPSEFSSSDEGGRLFAREYEAEKCATHLLPQVEKRRDRDEKALGCLDPSAWSDAPAAASRAEPSRALPPRGARRRRAPLRGRPTRARVPTHALPAPRGAAGASGPRASGRCPRRARTPSRAAPSELDRRAAAGGAPPPAGLGRATSTPRGRATAASSKDARAADATAAAVRGDSESSVEEELPGQDAEVEDCIGKWMRAEFSVGRRAWLERGMLAAVTCRLARGLEDEKAVPWGPSPFYQMFAQATAALGY